MNGYLLDTHYWLWYQMANAERIAPEARDQLIQMQLERELYLSATSVWEVARLVADGHIELPDTVDQFLEQALLDGGLILVPLTPKVLIESTRLPGNLHRDPADRMLVATARENGLTLVTRDKELLRYARKGYVSVQRL
jgi:PIN domain nuclease of toxin-antitoxin system